MPSRLRASCKGLPPKPKSDSNASLEERFHQWQLAGRDVELHDGTARCLPCERVMAIDGCLTSSPTREHLLRHLDGHRCTRLCYAILSKPPHYISSAGQVKGALKCVVGEVYVHTDTRQICESMNDST